jgi:MraZ protein
MFRGNFEHVIDQKGRVSIPSRFREVLRDKYTEALVISRWDGCLVAYPEDEWAKMEKRISELPQMNKNVIATQRFLISSAVECAVDKQGRILIPQYLRSHAGLVKDVVFAGMITRIEIWAKDTWEEGLKKTSDTFGDIAQTLGI